MAERIVTITVGQNGRLTAIDHRKVKAVLGDEIVWKFRGPRGNHWIGIGDFREYATGNAKNPTTKEPYSIDPADPAGEARATVKGSHEAQGHYRYRIVSIGLPRMRRLTSRMHAPRAFAAQAEYVLKVMMAQDADSELDPEVQIGG